MNSQMDKIDGKTDIWTGERRRDGHMVRYTYRQANGRTDKKTDKNTDRQTDIWTDRHKDRLTVGQIPINICFHCPSLL